jgi:hypothetical protein
MARLLIHVEGEAEETFVNEVLARHLYRHGCQKVSARLIGNSRKRGRRGGIIGWPAVRKDIVNHLREDSECVATTMVDYYGLPKAKGGAWPGRERAGNLPFIQKAVTAENALQADVCAKLGESFNAGRFIPFVLMHEFEGLLFSDCRKFAAGIGRPELAADFQRIRNLFSTPEEINDSPITTPSKRVEALMPGYEKPLLGSPDPLRAV